MAVIDRIGNRYTRLVVYKRGPNTPARASSWWCKCDCGNKLLVRVDSLTSGNTQSCGCLFTDTHTKHGMYGTSEYMTYQDMIGRCTAKHHPQWYNYGGRGINVCKRWSGQNGFQNFMEDMGRRPDKHQLDRRDNSKGYNKKNCRWVTPKINSNNTRINHRLTVRGQTKTISQWAEHRGMAWNTIYSRLQRGWSEEDSILTPVKQYTF